MPKLTLALIIGLILLTIILLFAATQTTTPPVQQPQPTVPISSPSPTPPAYTTLQMTPNPVTVSPDSTGTVQVLIDTQQNVATGVQIELSFDPKAITNVVVTPGTFFKNPLIIPQWNKVDQQTGRISHAQVLQPSQAGIKGQGVVATITFRKVEGTQQTQTQLQFMPKTAVTQAGISSSVLKATTVTTINLTTAQPTQ